MAVASQRAYTYYSSSASGSSTLERPGRIREKSLVRQVRRCPSSFKPGEVGDTSRFSGLRAIIVIGVIPVGEHCHSATQADLGICQMNSHLVSRQHSCHILRRIILARILIIPYQPQLHTYLGNGRASGIHSESLSRPLKGYLAVV